VGGTWWANTYPGCQCDIQSHLYSFSFAPNPDWARACTRPSPRSSPTSRRVTDHYGIRPHVRTGCAVTSATWAGRRRPLARHHRGGQVTADVLIAARPVPSAPPPSPPSRASTRSPAPRVTPRTGGTTTTWRTGAPR
jgi:cation diffusion facilitator CzcD-associated flavoprotein CzcO